MASLQHIRRRIASVKNTQKITKAMKLVSASKLRRAQERILTARPYAKKMAEVLGALGARTNREYHPLLQKRPVKKIEMIVLTSDRGLCGGFNTNILRRAMETVKELRASTPGIALNIVGRKGRDFFKRRDLPIRKEWTGISDRVQYDHAAQIGKEAIESYLNGTFDELYMVYGEFRSAIQTRIVTEKIFPIGDFQQEGIEIEGSFIYEPEEEEVLETLLPRYVEVQIFRGLLESAASEQGSRMMAMDSATRNAKEVIHKLTLVYNKTRQAAITKELMDIVGGAEALK
ncbi:MAG: ATP synthase F1 subunit gamma [Nitrospirae bacterium]|nr:ATP synthase F1 subunit gamma [Nitrospirota bacterium]